MDPPWAGTRTVSRVDAGGFTTLGSLGSGRLRSVTEFAGPGADAVERLVERALSALPRIVRSGHSHETSVQAERS